MFLTYDEQQQKMPPSGQDELRYIPQVAPLGLDQKAKSVRPSNDASSDEARPTHKPHAFILVVDRTRLCIHTAGKAKMAGERRIGLSVRTFLVMGRNLV